MLKVETEALLSRIRSGPSGPQIAAFFDFDGTLIQGYSSALLYEQRYRRLGVGLGETLRLIQFTRGEPSEADFRQLTTDGIKGWAGKDQAYLDKVSKDLWRSGISKMLFHEAWRLVKAHQRMGHTVVIASSATSVQIAALAEELGVTEVLCTQLEMVNGRATGKLTGRPLWGAGKEAMIREFAQEQGIDLAESFAYGNGNEDVPYLATVGHPVAVNPQPRLLREAQKRGWAVVFFEKSPGRFDLVPQLRVGGMWAALAGAGSTGVAMSLLSRNRWRGINLTIAAFSHLAAAFANVRVQVVHGREHLWSHRPAVFLINHQSDMLDILVCSLLLREDVTGLAKKEVASMPILGQVVSYAQFALVDRGDPTKAREALSDAVARVHQGISVVVAPEGTRSSSPSVGPFKKGGFHLAQQAGVPIVPIVIRNTAQLMLPRTRSVRPGTIEVVVHPPIPTDGWTKADLDRTVEEVHQFYVDTLESWPGPAAYVGQSSTLESGAAAEQASAEPAPEQASAEPAPVKPAPKRVRSAATPSQRTKPSPSQRAQGSSRQRARRSPSEGAQGSPGQQTTPSPSSPPPPEPR